MNSFRTLIDAFNNLPALAEALNVPLNSLYNFKRRDSVPPEYWQGLIDHAERQGVDGVTAQTLISLAAARRPAAEQESAA